MTVNITLDKEAEIEFRPVKLIMEITSPGALSGLKKLASLDVSVPKIVAEKSKGGLSIEERSSVEKFLATLQAALHEVKR